MIKIITTGIKSKKARTPYPGTQGPLGDSLFNMTMAEMAMA